MLSELFFYSFLSFIIIYIVHYLYYFLKDNLTTPKIKDLVERPTIEYDKIYKTLYQEVQQEKPEEDETMKNELKNYLTKLQHTKKEEVSEVMPSNEYTTW